MIQAPPQTEATFVGLTTNRGGNTIPIRRGMLQSTQPPRGVPSTSTLTNHRVEVALRQWPIGTTGAPLPFGIRHSGTIPGMDELSELEFNGHWRMAVWALRVGYVGLAVAIAGLIVLSLGSSPWVLAVGVIIWLAAAVVMAVGFLRSRHELPEPRPGFWSMRFKLIHDTVHARSSAQRS